METTLTDISRESLRMYFSFIISQKKPKLDLMLVTENLKEFHQENIKINKTHYTYSARFTKARIVNFF